MDLNKFVDNLEIDSPAYHLILLLAGMLIILSLSIKHDPVMTDMQDNFQATQVEIVSGAVS